MHFPDSVPSFLFTKCKCAHTLTVTVFHTLVKSIDEFYSDVHISLKSFRVTGFFSNMCLQLLQCRVLKLLLLLVQRISAMGKKQKAPSPAVLTWLLFMWLKLVGGKWRQVLQQNCESLLQFCHTTLLGMRELNAENGQNAVPRRDDTVASTRQAAVEMMWLCW